MALPMRRIKTVRNLRAEVHKIIRESIADGSLVPGAQLKESELVKDLGVSRTPIREALNQLASEGLIEIVPGLGTFVKRWTREEVLEILLIREALEGLAARCAVAHFTDKDIDQLQGYMNDYRRGLIDYAQADKRFHDHIIHASGMPQLIGLIHSLYDSLQMANMLRVIFIYPGRVEESVSEHEAMIESFRSGDGDAAEQSTREHFRQTRAYYRKFTQIDGVF